MIAVDTSLISSLAKINRLELLKEFSDVWTTAGVIEETVDSDIPSIINSVSKALDDWLETITVTDIKQIQKIQSNHISLSYVDSGLIVFCQKNDAMLLTDDTKMLSVAESEFDIDTYDLCEVLLALKNKDVLSKKRVLDIKEDLKKKDRYEFSEKDLERLIG